MPQNPSDADLKVMHHSFTISILKTVFGWNGVVPECLDWDDAETRIDPSLGSPSDCADAIAILLDAHGATWLPRLDGKPNGRLVVESKVVQGGI